LKLSDYLLGALGIYGLPLLFVALLVGSVGLPLPASFLLLAAGSFVAQDELSMWPVLGLAAAGAILGDNIGYALGRWGGHRVVERFRRRGNGSNKIAQAQAFAKRWGATGIFLTRWLITPLGPWLNLTSGMAGYPWMRFLFWDVLGEFLGVFIYVTLGRVFNDRVLAMEALLGDLSWGIVALLATVWLGWKLIKS